VVNGRLRSFDQPAGYYFFRTSRGLFFILVAATSGLKHFFGQQPQKT